MVQIQQKDSPLFLRQRRHIQYLQHGQFVQEADPQGDILGREGAWGKYGKTGESTYSTYKRQMRRTYDSRVSLGVHHEKSTTI